MYRLWNLFRFVTMQLTTLCRYAVDHPLSDKCGGKRAFELLKIIIGNGKVEICNQNTELISPTTIS